jgi:hypothetical protein
VSVVLSWLCVTGCCGPYAALRNDSACPTAAIADVDADWTGLERMRAWAANANTAAVAG